MPTTVTITLTSTDEEPDFEQELSRIARQLAEGYREGADKNETNSYNYTVWDGPDRTNRLPK